MTLLHSSEAFELRADEPPPLSPLLAVEPIPTVTRLSLHNGRVALITETDGGSEIDQRDLGRLLDVQDADVPVALLPILAQWQDYEADAIPYADLVAEQMRRY